MSKTKKIIISDGCTAFYTTVDGKLLYGEGNAMTDLERNEFVDYLLLRLKEHIDKGCVSIDDVIKLFQYDDYEYDEHSCDQCGDTVSRTYYEL